MIFHRREIEPRLQRILNEAVSSGRESACGLTVIQDGTVIADIVAGCFPDGRPVVASTLFPVFSVGKGIITTAFLRLVERGVIELDRPVADYWPEFGTNGKENLLVWHILSHRGGLFRLPPCGNIAELADWELMTRRMAGRKPEGVPGGKCVYHPLTFAWLLGETAARADGGRTFPEIVRDEVLERVGIANDCFFGSTPEAEARFIRLDISAVTPLESAWYDEFIHNIAIRRGFIPSANGLATSGAVARHYAALGGGELIGEELLAEATWLRRAHDDPPGDSWAKFGLGYALCGPAPDYGRMFGHGGAAGAEGFYDRESRIALGFVKNRLLSSHPHHPVRDLISAELGLPPRIW